jgi:outer membrane lipoprotein-sorting protein
MFRLPWVRRFFVGVSLSLSCTYAFAQHPGYREVSDLPGFRAKFKTESEKVQTITSNFTQEKNLLALTEKITSTGKFWFKRSQKVRIEYVKPFVYLLVMNGDKMLVKNDQKENRINVKSNKLFQQVNRIMIDCVRGTILDSKDFTSKVFENDKIFLMEMTPVSRALREFFQTIVLTVEKKDYSVNFIEMNEPSGDKTTIFFTEKKLNEQVPDTLFAF